MAKFEKEELNYYISTLRATFSVALRIKLLKKLIKKHPQISGEYVVEGDYIYQTTNDPIHLLIFEQLEYRSLFHDSVRTIKRNTILIGNKRKLKKKYHSDNLLMIVKEFYHNKDYDRRRIRLCDDVIKTFIDAGRIISLKICKKLFRNNKQMLQLYYNRIKKEIKDIEILHRLPNVLYDYVLDFYLGDKVFPYLNKMLY